MDANKATSISAGKAIYGVLSGNPVISASVTNIFPVAVDEAKLPYIVYKRIKGEYEPVKAGAGADASNVEVLCCAEDYDGAVDLAEGVNLLLNGRSGIFNGIRIRSCRYMDSDDFFEDDAYVVRIIFKVAIG